MRPKSILILLLVLGILGVVFAPLLHRAFTSALVLSELMNFESRGWLGRWTKPPQKKEFSYRGPNGLVRADLYIPQPGRKAPGILLNHGVIDTGKDDPRLKRFAEILCRAGFVVCVPDFRGMRSFRISPADIDEIQAAFERLISLKEHIFPESCGLFGFSYGAGPTIIAACRTEIRQKVRFVVSFGGYYDLKNVLSYMATGSFEFAGKRYYRKPQEYGKWVFLANNLDLVESPADRTVLREILKIKLRDENAPVDQFLPKLGGEGRNILNLLSHANPSQTESFIRNLPHSVRASMDALSVSGVVKDLQANLILAHGEDDDLIPFTETLRLAQAAPNSRKVHCQILKIFSHVDPEQMDWTMKNLISFYLPEGWKLYRVVYRLISYR
jgi:dienelactone hydrolase